MIFLLRDGLALHHLLSLQLTPPGGQLARGKGVRCRGKVFFSAIEKPRPWLLVQNLPGSSQPDSPGSQRRAASSSPESPLSFLPLALEDGPGPGPGPGPRESLEMQSTQIEEKRRQGTA